MLVADVLEDELEVEEKLFELLQNHYGDGSVYLPNGTPQELLLIAREYGYLDAEDYLTRKGRTFIASVLLCK